MGKYDSKLLGSEEIAQSTLAFHFEKPAGFTFTPGQSINLFLPEDFPGVSDDRQRAFSLVSAPHEDRLTIATRMRKSAYKQPLKDAAPGAAVRIRRPPGRASSRHMRAPHLPVPAMSMARAPILSPNAPKTLDRSPTPSVKGTNGSEDRRSGIPRRYGNYICHLLENFAPRCDLIE